MEWFFYKNTTVIVFFFFYHIGLSKKYSENTMILLKPKNNLH